MQRSLLLSTLLAVTLSAPSTYADADNSDASGTIDCHHTINIVSPEMQSSSKAHVLTTIKHVADDIYDIDITTTGMDDTEHNHYRLPIKRVDDMWEIELNKAHGNDEDNNADDIDDGDGDGETDGEIMKIRYDQYNGVQPSISLGGSPFISMLNGTYQKDGQYMQIDGRCEFKPAQ